MKIKHEQFKYIFGGDVHTLYIRKIKRHWWSPWRIVMDGQVPAIYHLVDGEFIRSI